MQSVSAFDQDMTSELFVEIMKLFFDRGWMVGSGGGMAVTSKTGVIFYSPSSVQKERLLPNDLFVLSQETLELVSRPQNPNIRESDCVPIFNLLLNDDEETNCVIHTHSKYANLLTQLLGHDETFEISDQEMIKGIMNRRTRKNYSNIEILCVPIIENATHEYMLLPQVKTVLEKYPDASAVLVRNHGLFVWGPTWQRTKIMLECYEYLFELACDMIKCSIPLVKSLKVN
uniref:Class II aldolase/adducin N-terminal domain-containing protein n=1 Tax=Panagrolaimus superbus TaxID=310955 RepID=A0A914YK55_9BILA